LAFDQVRAEIRPTPRGKLRAEVWVNALLNDGEEEDELSAEVTSNIMSFEDAKLNLIRQLVQLIDDRHRVWSRYPVLQVLARSHGCDDEGLGPAYLRHLRRDLETASAPRTGPNPLGGSVVALRAVEGCAEGP
jgi:hypothetical protein